MVRINVPPQDIRECCWIVVLKAIWQIYGIVSDIRNPYRCRLINGRSLWASMIRTPRRYQRKGVTEDVVVFFCFVVQIVSTSTEVQWTGKIRRETKLLV